MYTIIRTTTQNFLKKIMEFGIEKSLQNFSFDKKRLLLNVVPFFYSQFMERALYFQKLQVFLLQKYGNVPITVFSGKDDGVVSIFLKQCLQAGDEGDYYWRIEYLRLFIFVEKNEAENIWLYTPQYVTIPFIEYVIIPENTSLEALIDCTRANLSSIVEKTLQFTNRPGCANNDNIKVVPIKISPLVVDYLKNEKGVSFEAFKDELFQFIDKQKQQIVSSLKENSESFIEAVVSYYVDMIKNREIVLPSISDIVRRFLHSKKQMINSIVDGVIDKITIKVKDKIEKMSLEELEYYNDKNVIYNELLKMHDEIDILTGDMKKNLFDFIYESYDIKLQIENCVDMLKRRIYNFHRNIDGNGYIISHFEKSPFMQEIVKKIKTTKRITKDLHDLIFISKLFFKKTPPLDYLDYLGDWIVMTFFHVCRDFFKLYKKEKFDSNVVSKVKERLELLIDMEIQKIAEIAVQELSEEIKGDIRRNFLPQMVEEIKSFIEELISSKKQTLK